MALRLDTEAQWEDFLKEADIPEEEATQYAKIFKDNRIKAAALPDLTDVLLKTLGITIIGDILAIIRHAKAQSQPVPTQQQAPVAQTLAPAFKAPTAAARLPTITADMTHQQYRKFRVDWEVYKQITAMPTSHAQNHLYNACNDDVQTSLISCNSHCLTLSEPDLLNIIETVVTKHTNPAVHKIKFRKQIQQDSESIKEFVVRLKSTAVDCEFTCPKCKADISESIKISSSADLTTKPYKPTSSQKPINC